MKSVYVVAFLLTLVFSGCCNDDYATYTNYSNDYSLVSTSPSINSISDLGDDAKCIAGSYAQNLKLTEVNIAVIKDNKMDSVKLAYVNLDDSICQVTKVVITFDCVENMFVSANFEQGHTKRVECSYEPLDGDYCEISFLELLEQASKYIENTNMDYTITLRSNKMNVRT